MAKKGSFSATFYVVTIAVTFIISLFVIFMTSHGYDRINTSGELCHLCHTETIKYDFDDYRESRFSRLKVTSGARIGCAECHPYPFREFQKSTHYNSRSGVRPGCVNCHEPHSITQLVRWKFLYINTGTHGDSPFHYITGIVMDKDNWDRRRVVLAERVRNKMLANDSAKCRGCHQRPLIESESKPVMRAHKKMETQNKTCIDCHYNLVHADVPWDDDEDDDDDDDDEDEDEDEDE